MKGPNPVCTSATKNVNQSSPRWLRRDAAIGGSGGCRLLWPGRQFVIFVPAALDPASVGFAGIARCRCDRQGYFSGVAAPLDGVARSLPAAPSTTTGSPRLYSGATLT